MLEKRRNKKEDPFGRYFQDWPDQKVFRVNGKSLIQRDWKNSPGLFRD